MSKKGKELIGLLNKMELTPHILVMWQGPDSEYEKMSCPPTEDNLLDAQDAGAGDIELTELGEIEFVESGGIHHDGGAIWSVFYFKKFDIHLAAEATYSSWDSEDYSEEWVEVKQKEVTITQWIDPDGSSLA